MPVPLYSGRTPLHAAVANNHADVVRVLIESGADVYVKDEKEITTMLLAGKEVNRDKPTEMTKFAENVAILVDALPRYDELTRRKAEEYLYKVSPPLLELTNFDSCAELC